MSAATLTAENLRGTQISATTDTFVHQPWCADHWDADDDVCWAEDIAMRIQPEAGDRERGRLTAVMTHGARPDGEPVNITLFSDMVRDGEGSVEFTPDEAETAAHMLLAAVMRSRGFTSAADWHETTAKRCAAELLARRTGGAK